MTISPVEKIYQEIFFKNFTYCNRLHVIKDNFILFRHNTILICVFCWWPKLDFPRLQFDYVMWILEVIIKYSCITQCFGIIEACYEHIVINIKASIFKTKLFCFIVLIFLFHQVNELFKYEWKRVLHTSWNEK